MTRGAADPLHNFQPRRRIRPGDGGRRVGLVRAGAEQHGQAEHAPLHAVSVWNVGLVILPLRPGVQPAPMVKVPRPSSLREDVASGTVALRSCSIRVRLTLPLFLLAATTACTPATNDTGAAFTGSGQVIAMSGGDGGPGNACFSCHGLNGEGDGVSVPRLAGLDAGYLQKQMEDYANDVRQDTVMSQVAGWLDDDDRRAVSAWYASLPPTSAPTSPTAAPAIYLRGAPRRGVTACASCHGVAGEGLGAANPAIAAQPAAYTIDQLNRWKTAKRRNDPRGVMADAVAGLTA
ncbi:MAG: c-type cytochrome, partial [Caulobacteraceae bacterium]